ncbi:hypothetical protein HDU81_007991 [Chytriomyces hyalinus]|nr:hypothetical protein HDU81_007991 [Chytriomyces hyalinus]
MRTIPGSVFVPVWLYLPVVFGTTSLTHFALLRTANVSNEAVATINVLIAFFLPLLVQCDLSWVNTLCACTVMVFVVLRVLEISTFNRSINSKWTLFEYLEFLATSDNQPLRTIQKQKLEKERKEREEKKLPPLPEKFKPCIAKPEDRTPWFYVQLLTRLALTSVVYLFSRAYIEKYGFVHRFGFISPFEGKVAWDHVVFSAFIYCNLELGYMTSSLIGAIIMQTPLVFMFHHPYLATSLRDFWSNRWNYAIKETLHRLSFLPTLQILARINPSVSRNDSTIDKKQAPAAHFAIASMASFFMSAMMHEYMVLLLMPSQSIGENTCFFMLQGMLCFIQIHLQRMTGFGKTWGTGVVGTLIGWSTTMILLFIMNPLFIGPYARSGLLSTDLKVPVPEAIMDTIKTLI